MKFNKIFISIVAAFGVLVGCQKQEIAQMVAPEDVAAPVLESIGDIEFSLENIAEDSLVINWTPLNYGVPVEVAYTLEVSVSGGNPVQLFKDLKKTSYISYYEELNAVLRYKLGLESGKSTDVQFRMSAKFLDYEPVYSEVETAKMTVVDAMAPVLDAYDGEIEINADNLATGKAAFSWQPAKYGKKTEITYNIEVGLRGGDKKVKVASHKGEEMTVEAKYSDINGAVLYDLSVPANQKTEVLYYVSAQIGEYATIYSEPVAVNTVVTTAEKEYKKMYVVGSYCTSNWDHSLSQFLFDFGGEDKNYSGVINFNVNDNDIATNEFKITSGGWGKDEHSMAEGGEKEAAELKLVNGGGANINAYQTYNFYHFTLTKDAEAPVLAKNLGFNQIGVIGANGDWNNDIVMNFNASKQVFYADVEFTGATEFKFRGDAAWDINWGVTDGAVVSGGGNIPATAGTYRVYLNINNLDEITYELNAAMYGQEEPTSGTVTPTPPPTPTVQGWGLVGEYNGWGESPDVMLASDGTYLAAKGVEISGQVKFRKDGAWDVNFGAPGDVEPVEIAVNTELELVAGGKNFTIAAGTYDVYLDEANAKAWFINDGSYPGGGAAPEASEWGVVGDVNGWAAPDITMYKTATEGLFVAYNVILPDGGFKIRANGEWKDDANYGLEIAGNVEVDHVYGVITSGGSGNMTIVAGTYDIWFDLTNAKVYIMTPGKPISEAVGGEAVAPDPDTLTWYLVGNFNGWAVADTNYQLIKEGDWYVCKNVTFDGQGVKFNAGSWSVNRGGTFVAANEAIAVEHDGPDMLVAAGTYDVYMNAAADTAYFMEVGKTPAN